MVTTTVLIALPTALLTAQFMLVFFLVEMVLTL